MAVLLRLFSVENHPVHPMFCGPVVPFGVERVKDLTLVEMEDQTSCCGFGGTFAVKFPMISTAMGETKSALTLETKAEYLVSSDSRRNEAHPRCIEAYELETEAVLEFYR